jgi:hypothetical protein
MRHPKRLAPATRALFEALDSLDHAAMRSALLDGADTESTDMDGATPLYRLQACSDSFPEETQRLVALCAETLLAAGADAQFHHAVPSGPEAEALCLTREHQCEGCPLKTGTAEGDACEGHGIDEFVHAGACSEAFTEVFLPWLLRHKENPALLAEMRDGLAAERVAIALEKGTLPGNTKRGPWRGPRP